MIVIKKLVIVLFFLFLISCSQTKNETSDLLKVVNCPKILFSKEHRLYIASDEYPIKLNNITYSAELKNYYIDSWCEVTDKIIKFDLSLLFLVEQRKSSENNFLLQYYIAIIDQDDNLVDVSYYKIEGSFEGLSKNKFIQQDIIENLNIKVPYFFEGETNITKLLIGFLIDEEKKSD